MPDRLQELVDTLLWEAYALFPYTPGSIKNATPTPFGIVYPPAYAAGCPGAFDRARLEAVAVAEPGSTLTATLHWLEGAGERHQARPCRLQVGPVPVGERATETFDGGRLTLRSQLLDGGGAMVRCCVHNTRPGGAGADRAAALALALLSTQIVVTIAGGRFRSPLDRDGDCACESVNTYPVLVGDHDEAVLGTAIVLPDHPQLAPESRGDLFDATEIEEALLLHVHALSDGEREEIERQDPRLREMVARAAATTPDDIFALHGRVTLRDPVRDPVTTTPPVPSTDLPDPQAGQADAVVDGVRFERGARLILRPGPDADLHARLLAGQPATIERIFTDYDGRVHLGVTVDSDPGQDLLRETNRFLFFFPEEVEVA
ncbi:MAG: hypothetical protein ACRDMJ_14585 [Solirubrobacteraceae bacterium]